MANALLENLDVFLRVFFGISPDTSIESLQNPVRAWFPFCMARFGEKQNKNKNKKRKTKNKTKQKNKNKNKNKQKKKKKKKKTLELLIYLNRERIKIPVKCVR